VEGAGLGQERAAKVITKWPQVLGYNVRQNLAPAVRHLAEELALGREGAAKVITTFPQVLGLSVEYNVAPKVRYFEEELGLGCGEAHHQVPSSAGF
jgi:mTERF domain-containing protein